MAARDLQYIDLVDFTPGIASGWNSSGNDEAFPDGFARMEDTYGCYGLERGGLAPLPRLTFSRDGGEPNTGVSGEKWPTVADGYPEGYDHRIAVLDAVVIAPVTYSPALDNAVTTTFPQVDLFTVRQWYVVNNADTKVDAFWRFRGHPIYTGNTTGAFAARDIRAQSYLSTWNPDPTRWKYGWGSIAQTRTTYEGGDARQISPPVLGIGMGGTIKFGGLNEADPEGIEAAQYFTYPDYKDEDGTNNTPKAVDRTADMEPAFGVALPGMVFGHQGRLVSIGRQSGYRFARRLSYHGDEGGVQSANELVFYWPVNDIYSAAFKIAAWGEEQTSGYGTWFSVNANSLLLIKNKGGAVQISGDINSPSVTRLPGVPSIGGRANRGAATDKGYAYGSNSGVWMWTGSDTAVNLSTMLDPDFWVPDDITIDRRQLGQMVGSFAFSFPYLFAPNNWVLDMRKGGWFRYHPTPDQDSDDGTTFAFNEVDHQGNLWTVVPSYEIDSRHYSMFDMKVPCAKYVWHSQPLAKSRNRFLDYRDIRVVASGKGRIRIEVVGLDLETPQTVEFDVDSTKATSLNTSLGVVGTDIEIVVTCEAAVSDDPAPTIHRISLGYIEAQSIGRG